MRVLRKGICRRKTKEVDVYVEVDLDNEGYKIETDLPFFKHMLETFARHSSVKLILRAYGDDEHHTIEDTAIALGKAIKRALGYKRGIKRFGYAMIPMDDALAMCALDVSGRGYFVLDGNLHENYTHFFDTLCRNSGMNVHIVVKGFNSHHTVEACFKAFAIAFKEAVKIVGGEVASTKGVLD